MGRSRVKLELIKQTGARNATFKKRKNGLFKKVKELSILCGVPACAIVYGESGEQLPEIWPSSQSEVCDVLGKFYGLTEMEKSKNMENQVSFSWRKVQQETERLRKLRRKNKAKEMNLLMEKIHFHGKSLEDLNNIDDLNYLKQMAEEKEKQIQRQIDLLKGNQNVVADPSMSVLINPNTLLNTTNLSIAMTNFINDIKNRPNMNQIGGNYNNFSIVGGVEMSMVPAPQMQLQPTNTENALQNQPYWNSFQHHVFWFGDQIVDPTNQMQIMQQNLGLTNQMQMQMQPEGILPTEAWNGYGDVMNNVSYQQTQIQNTNIGNNVFGDHMNIHSQQGGQLPYYMVENNNNIENVGFGNQMHVPSHYMQMMQGGHSPYRVLDDY